MKDDVSKDWFGAAEGRPDPMRSARAGADTALPKRFYREAGIAETADGFALVLDGRPARTPARNPLALPTHTLGEAVAAEWGAQGEAIVPASMPLTKLANSAIDGVASRREAVADDVARYAGSDLVAYRAGDPASLVAAQSAAWDPVLDWAHDALGARFVLSEGVMHVAQPETSLAAVRRRVDAEASPFRLAALHAMTALTGSVLIALATAEGRFAAEEAWAAALVDEDFQARVWGRDEDAEARRVARFAEFLAAARLHSLA